MPDSEESTIEIGLRDSLVAQGTLCESRPTDCPPSFQTLYDYWKEVRDRTGRQARWSDVELMDLWEISSKLIVFDIVWQSDGTYRCQYRYAGTSVRNYIKMDITGLYMEELFSNSNNADFYQLYDEMFASGLPQIQGLAIDYLEGLTVPVEYSRINVPLYDDSGKPAHGMGVLDFISDPIE